MSMFGMEFQGLESDLSAAGQIRRLSTENERMREALEELRVLGEQGAPPDHSRWLAFHDRVAEVAKRGLGTDKR